MIKKIEQYETTDGETFSTEADAEAHEKMLDSYDSSLKELKELLTKAQIMLDTKPELSKLNDRLDYDGNMPSGVLSRIDDYDTEKDLQFNYYTSNC